MRVMVKCCFLYQRFCQCCAPETMMAVGVAALLSGFGQFNAEGIRPWKLIGVAKVPCVSEASCMQGMFVWPQQSDEVG